MENNTQGMPSWKLGTLPSPAPLALSFVPMQPNADTRYEPDTALTRGTLFPGLDLPFMNMVNTPPDAPGELRELMALDFVVKELTLYLDTHEDDDAAFALLRQYLELAGEARRRYTQRCGPLMQTDLQQAERYTWLCSPWPWEYQRRDR